MPGLASGTSPCAKTARRAKCCASSPPPSRSTSCSSSTTARPRPRSIPYIRDGLTKFVERMQGKAQIGIVTIGERPTSVVEYTTDAAALKKGIGRIFARPGSGAYLLEAVRDVSRGMQRREGPRPVIHRAHQRRGGVQQPAVRARARGPAQERGDVPRARHRDAGGLDLRRTAQSRLAPRRRDEGNRRTPRSTPDPHGDPRPAAAVRR